VENDISARNEAEIPRVTNWSNRSMPIRNFIFLASIQTCTCSGGRRGLISIGIHAYVHERGYTSAEPAWRLPCGAPWPQNQYASASRDAAVIKDAARDRDGVDGAALINIPWMRSGQSWGNDQVVSTPDETTGGTARRFCSARARSVY